jgi:glycosyltransferase involved in cell wall biosynthesis
MNKKIAIIGTVGIPAKYGGFETLTEYLTENLYKKYNITVYCSSKSYKNKLEYYNGAKLEYINFNANGIQSIPYDIISIIKSLKKSDTLLILGVSGCIILPIIRIFSKKNIIVNIDGLEWKRNKWGKFAKWFLKYSEKLAVKYANSIVADNKVIQEYVKKEYNKESKLIAYGANHVNKEFLTDNLKEKYPFLKKAYAFTVCRIEPENNIEMILEAFKKNHKLVLIIVGNWNNSEYGIKLKNKYHIYKNIHLINPIYEQSILNQIRSNCKIYIHGHSAGGTNPSLVEAMYLGLAIFSYKIKYNQETTQYKALYFKNSNEIISLLNNITEDTLDVIKKDMKSIAIKNYTWNKISQQYMKLFE